MFETSTDIILEGNRVRLTPLTPDHAINLYSILQDSPKLMQFSPSVINSIETAQEYIRVALNAKKQGRAYPFAVLESSSQTVLGTTRYGNISSIHNRLEIGWTFLNPLVHGTGINTEMKYLMLNHAFEELTCNRVELKTDSRNLQSRKAILKLGAKEEGTLRSHTLMSDGYRRDTVYYSILKGEWPQIKTNLISRIRS